MFQIILIFRFADDVSNVLPWPEVSGRVEPVVVDHPDMPAAYVCSCCVPLPAYVSDLCSAGQEVWRPGLPHPDPRLSETVPTEHRR